MTRSKYSSKYPYTYYYLYDNGKNSAVAYYSRLLSFIAHTCVSEIRTEYALQSKDGLLKTDVCHIL